jgi:hypothetical protein
VSENVRIEADTTSPDGQMHEAVAAIAGCGISPIVRIAANEGWMVKSNSSSALIARVLLRANIATKKLFFKLT